MSPPQSEDFLPFQEDALGAVSRALSEAVFSAMPQLQQYARMFKSGEADGLSLDLNVPSPTNDPDRSLVIWVDEVATPSIGFGPSHTHEDSSRNGIVAIVDLAAAILQDRLLIIVDVGGKHPGHSDWIDLRETNALEDALTSPYSPGLAFLKSWSGNADREVNTENL